ncbi:MAG: dihydrolipoyl dehydrogenase [Alphaproteobacteria bacterium]|nr:dihydrolipoyl dehydrogenase [Alphaproteobacteria bacterium]
MKVQKDLCIIGGGPGGYVAAIRAAQKGKSVVVCDAHKMGGVCLHYGCIPTKTLLESAHLYEQILNASHMGITVAKPDFSVKKCFHHVKGVSGTLEAGIHSLLKKHKIQIVKSQARLNKFREVVCEDGTIIQSKDIILATGSTPLLPPIDGLSADAGNIWTSRSLLENPPEASGHFLIVGAGPIGVEFASFYRMLGAEVTIVERLNHILPSEEVEITNTLRDCLIAKGIKIKVGTSVQKVLKKNEVLLRDNSGKDECVRFNNMIIAAGIRPNTKGIGLEALGIKTNERGFITVSKTMETTLPHIYAIGDIVPGPALAHKASYEGILAVDVILGEKRECLHYHNIARCVYSSPQVASVGWTEQELKDQKTPYKSGSFPYAHNGRALSAGSKEGFIKLLFHMETGEVLGAHIIGEHASELINTIAFAITAEATYAEFMNTVFPHPTLSEMLQEAALDAYGIGLHA